MIQKQPQKPSARRQPAPPPRASDWLTANPDDFVGHYAPHVRAAKPPRPRAGPSSPRQTQGETPGTAVRIEAPPGPPRTNTSPTTKDDQTKMNEVTLRTLMTTPPGTILPHPVTGRPTQVADLLQEYMRGEAGTVQVPASPGPATGRGGSAQPSQAAIEALSERDYEELQRTGHLEGLTKPLETAHVNVRVGGAIRTHAIINADGRPETVPAPRS